MSGGLDEKLLPPKYVLERCDYVGSRYTLRDYLIFSSLFTLNLPQKVDQKGFVVSEAKQTYKYFSSRYGLDDKRTYLEHSSFDTIGSVYFSLRLILDLNLSVQEVVFVTSSFHLKRTMTILSYLAPLLGVSFDVSVESPPSEAVLDATKREAHELAQVETIKELFKNFITVSDFSRWLYTSHDNYSLEFKSNRKNAKYLY